MQVDVFGELPFTGNPLLVVLDGEGLSAEQMQRVADWATVAETTFLLPPTEPGADYRVRIFTPDRELPFAGHPTLGTAHAWLAHQGRDHEPVVQQCAAGMVPVRPRAGLLSFAAPALVRSGPVGPSEVVAMAGALGLDPARVVEAQWVDNGPGWAAFLLDSVESVLAVAPGRLDFCAGLVGMYPAGGPFAYEVRAFTPGPNGTPLEDPVTGSLNASLAQWLTASGRATPPYVASQGTALGRQGRAYIQGDEEGRTWVGGRTVTCSSGTLQI
jgi:PhzF family phenazine biosynthesis protein